MAKCQIINGDCRQMKEIEDETVSLVVTSPPYWNLKDYGHPEQIGYGQKIEDYYSDLIKVWSECMRVLKPGKFIAINVGDVYFKDDKRGVFKIIPLHAEIIKQMEKFTCKHLGTIIWHKRRDAIGSGGGRIPGSYPYPYNGRILYNHEYIMIFQKNGKQEKVIEEIKEKSKLTLDEWRTYFNSIWTLPNQRMKDHIACFPEEIPKRLIKMFSFVGETVLDPFGGIGTTCKAALNLNRNCIMYELNPEYAKKAMNNLQNYIFLNNEVSLITTP